MKLLWLITGFLLLSASCSNQKIQDTEQSKKVLEQIKSQYNLFLELNLGQTSNFEIQFCDGYFAGVNWNMYILSGQREYEELAIESLEAMELSSRDSIAWCTGNQLMAGFGKGINVTQNDSYREHLINAVKKMTHLFNPETGTFYLNGYPQNDYGFTFGFESIMNLESLFFVARLTADPVYYNIATKHAEIILNSYFENTVKTNYANNLPKDPKSRVNSELFSDNPEYNDSLKVNALVVYSCAIMFRETGEIKYLRTAERIVSEISKQFGYSEILFSGSDHKQNNIENNHNIASLAVLASALYDLWLSTGSVGNYSERANEIISFLSTKRFFEYKIMENPDKLKQRKSEFDRDLTRENSFFIEEYFFLEALVKRQKLMELSI